MYNINNLKTRKMNFFLIIFLLFLNGIFADENISIFQQNAINYDSIYFNINSDFEILGNIEIKGRKIVLANNVHIWGESRRATWRFLLFLDDGTFLGMYTGIAFNTNEIRIEGQKIYFPFDPEIGNKIDFTNGIPDRVWIDGYVLSYKKINDIKW
jgi:hypothetical protein